MQLKFDIVRAIYFEVFNLIFGNSYILRFQTKNKKIMLKV